MTTETRFISVEVVIRTNSECREWISWFEQEDNYVVSNATENHSNEVFFAPLSSENANATIRRLCQEFDSLPEYVRRHWRQADEREFFIGYHVGETPHCYIEHLEAKTLNMVHQQDASIRIAMYAAPTESE